MKKKLTLALAIIMAAGALSGCSGSTPSTSSESAPSQSVDSAASSSSDTSATTAEPDSATEQAASQESTEVPTVTNSIAAQFETPAGDVPDFSKVSGANGEMDISELTDNWNYVMCADYVYLAEPLGISYNSTENPDIYDADSGTFIGVPKTVNHEYKRFNVGDAIGGLTIKECYTTFISYLGNSTPRYFGGGKVSFDGEITMSGVCCVVPETQGYDEKGDIYFIPDSASQFPVMNYVWNEDGTEIILSGKNWCSEYQIPLNIGNISESSGIDLSALPTDGTYVPVKVTVNNIMLRNDFNVSRKFRANMSELEML